MSSPASVAPYHLLPLGGGSTGAEAGELLYTTVEEPQQCKSHSGGATNGGCDVMAGSRYLTCHEVTWQGHDGTNMAGS